MAAAGFETSQPGTALSCWTELLAHRARWLFPLQVRALQRLVVVAPHPDDETLGAGGLIHTWIQHQRPVTAVSVTDGEASNPTRRDLADVRQRELQRALAMLGGPSITRVRLGLPDGRVRRWTRSLRTLLRPLFSESVIVAPFERDGHPDHEAVGRVCCRLAAAQATVLARYPIWAWHQAEPQRFIDYEWLRFPLSMAARRVKKRAIHCFESQLGGPQRSAILPGHVLEYFAQPEEAFVL